MWSVGSQKTAANPQPPLVESPGRQEAERLLRRVDERWRALARANERGLSLAALERLYEAYVQAVDAYIAHHGAALNGGVMRRSA